MTAVRRDRPAGHDASGGQRAKIVDRDGEPALLGWPMLAAAAIPMGDAMVVLRSRGPKVAAYGIHGATAVVMLATSLVFLIA